MKISRLCLFASLLFLCSCANHYVVTLNNGGQITSAGKPKHVDGAYQFKDVSGKEQSIPDGRVREVSPASMMDQPAKAPKKPVEKKHWYYLWLA